MLGIIFATKMEASPFLKTIEASPIKKSPFLVFKPSKYSKMSPCFVIISGIGKVAAAVATVELILNHGANMIINSGICGALCKGFSTLGTIYRISQAIEGDRNLSCRKYIKTFECFPFFEDLKEAVLITSDKAIFDDKLRSDLANIADLVDMEGAAIVRVANMYNVKCDAIKGVTDLANTGGIKTMESNVKTVSSALSEVLFNYITE